MTHHGHLEFVRNIVESIRNTSDDCSGPSHMLQIEENEGRPQHYYTRSFHNRVSKSREKIIKRFVIANRVSYFKPSNPENCLFERINLYIEAVPSTL